MRQKRAKAYRKQMLVYNHTFKFREPYQVIVDDSIVLTCDGIKFDLAKGLSRTVQSEVKPMITQCCMQALYKTDNQSAISTAKEFERRRCNHPPTDPLPPHECIKSITDIKGQNKHRYVVASDNDKLRFSLRRIPGIPLIHMSRSVMIMEPLSKASAEVSDLKESSKLTAGLNSVRSGVVGDDDDKTPAEGEQPSKKRRGPKEPNPLSVLKKKKKNPDSLLNQSDDKKKRKRKHKKASAKSNDQDDGADGENEATEESKNEETSNIL